MAGNLTTNVYLDEYLDYLGSRKYSEHTVNNYGKYVSAFLSHCEEQGVNPLEVNTLQVQIYIDSFEDKPPTANLIKNSLRSYYDYLCTVRQVIAVNPAAGAKGVKMETEEKEYLTADQVGTVLQLLNLYNRTIYIKGKGKRNRIAYMTDKMMDYMLAYLNDRDRKNPKSAALFPSQDGTGRIARTTIQSFLHKVEAETGMHLNPHKFRHTGATLAYQESNDLVAVQNLLGHENIESTKRYTHVSEENRRNLINNSPINAVL